MVRLTVTCVTRSPPGQIDHAGFAGLGDHLGDHLNVILRGLVRMFFAGALGIAGQRAGGLGGWRS